MKNLILAVTILSLNLSSFSAEAKSRQSSGSRRTESNTCIQCGSMNFMFDNPMSLSHLPLTNNNSRKAKTESGSGRGCQLASNYGGKFIGRKTASGLRYSGGRLTVAHKSLPFGTQVRLTYGGRSVVATVTDRGPFVRGRTWDLSQATKRALGAGGVACVHSEIMGRVSLGSLGGS